MKATPKELAFFADGMARAVSEARKGEGKTRPNPPVGAVVVRGRALVGAGYHRQAGGPHGEIHALKEAGTAARGATIFVTLEPCSTTGRTGPCTEALIEAGIRRVVVGVKDPNPQHRGRGLRKLRDAGMEVVLLNDPEARQLIEPFTSLMVRGRPWLTLKMASSLDGRIAEAKGHSQWITGPASRKVVHALRRRVDGILVGTETTRLDNPGLLPRPAGGRLPWRIVLDARGRLSLKARVFTEAPEQTMCCCGPEVSRSRIKRLQGLGIEVLEIPVDKKGHLKLPEVLSACGDRGLLHILCEGGGALAGSLIDQALVDEFWHFQAPIFLGPQGRPLTAGKDHRLSEVQPWSVISRTPLGIDLLTILRPPSAKG